MLLFLIKKMFFDMWDNLLTIFILNIALLLLFGLLLLPLQFITKIYPVTAIFYIIISLYSIISLLILNLSIGIISGYTKDISDYKKPGFRDFIIYLKNTWKSSIINTIFSIIILAIALAVIPYYLFKGTIIHLILCGVVFWTTITIILAFSYYIPISIRLDKGIKKNIKNCFLLLFDNTAFTFFLVIISILLFAISFFTIFLVPGIATLTLWGNVCVKILLFKYDYLEQNPDANRKKIPWTELILDDQKKVGKRTLRGMIFPWKE